MEERGVIGASGDVLGGTFSRVFHRARSVVTLTIVQHVGAVKVVDVKVLGNIIDDAVDVAFDVACDGREDRRGGRAIEKRFAQHRRIER